MNAEGFARIHMLMSEKLYMSTGMDPPVYRIVREGALNGNWGFTQGGWGHRDGLDTFTGLNGGGRTTVQVCESTLRRPGRTEVVAMHEYIHAFFADSRALALAGEFARRTGMPAWDDNAVEVVCDLGSILGAERGVADVPHEAMEEAMRSAREYARAAGARPVYSLLYSLANVTCPSGFGVPSSSPAPESARFDERRYSKTWSQWLPTSVIAVTLSAMMRRARSDLFAGNYGGYEFNVEPPAWIPYDSRF